METDSEQERLRQELYEAARECEPPPKPRRFRLRLWFPEVSPRVFRIGMLACLAGFVALAVLCLVLVRS